MSLTLEIVGPQAAQLGAAARKTFLKQGGSIGRASINDWVIPDAYVSGQHARVHFREGRYFLEDTSTNGVFIKNPGNRLPKGQQYPLQSGDRVFIDAYEIKVTIEGEEVSRPPSNPGAAFDMRADAKMDDNKSNGVIATVVLEKPRASAGATSEVNGIPVELTIPLPEPSDAIVDPAAMDQAAGFGLDHQEPLESPGVDFDPFGDALPEVNHAVNAAENMRTNNIAVSGEGSSAAAMPSIDIHALLASAGLNEASITPEFAANLGRILQVVIAGVMQLLQTREQARTEFGMRNTSYKKADNNPLKFSVNVEDALHNLLVKRNAAYLGPVDAFEDAFRDMRNHELATLHAMKAAFDGMLQSFNPDSLQVAFNKEVKQGTLWSGPIKLRYWELYRERYKTFTRNAEQCFHDLFADEFVKAYSAHLEKLKSGDDNS